MMSKENKMNLVIKQEIDIFEGIYELENIKLAESGMETLRAAIETRNIDILILFTDYILTAMKYNGRGKYEENKCLENK